MPIIAFDLYGTLLSTDSIAAELANVVGHEHAKALAALWRRYQLEYTWRINSMGHYRPFTDLTLASLHHAAAELDLALSDPDAARVMAAYDALHAFPEAAAALRALLHDDDDDDGAGPPAAAAAAAPARAYVFSNGTPAMISSSVASSPDLGPLAGALSGFVSVDGARVYKPHPRAYGHLLESVGKEGEAAGDVWLVSSNPFDVVGAVSAGLRAVWVDRTGKGWVDRLGDVVGGVRPTAVVKGVDEAVREVLKATS